MQFPSPLILMTLLMSGRVSGVSLLPGLIFPLGFSNLRPMERQALRCYSSSTQWYLNGHTRFSCGAAVLETFLVVSLTLPSPSHSGAAARGLFMVCSDLSQVPMSFHFLHAVVLGMSYCGKSFLYDFLNLLISARHLLFTHMEAGSKEARCNPSRERTLESATYAMPSANTFSERSTMAQSRDSPWHCLVNGPQRRPEGFPTPET